MLTVALVPTGTVEKPLAEARDVMTGGEPTTGIIEELATDTEAGMPGDPETKLAAAVCEVAGAAWDVTALA